MNSNPTVEDAVAFLRASHEEGMALVVESMADSERRSRRAHEDTLRLYYELRRSLDPQAERRRWPSSRQAPPQSDG